MIAIVLTARRFVQVPCTIWHTVVYCRQAHNHHLQVKYLGTIDQFARATQQDEVGVVINDSGQPAQSALTFPSTPIALAASGLYILAACTDGVHVYDRTSASWVQSLPYPPGVTPSPGQSIITAYNNKGSCVLFSGLQKVSLCANLQFAL